MDGLPPVTKCQVENCFYNRSLMCHAPAINVGGDHPNCDTFIPQGSHIGRQGTGMVGACHVEQCRWNQEMTCHAAGIMVSSHDSHADCKTFEAQSSA